MGFDSMRPACPPRDALAAGTARGLPPRRPRPVALGLLVVVLAGCLSSPPPRSVVAIDALRFGTDAGDVLIALYPEAAPRTLALMDAFARERYFTGREFNRVVPGHVIQVIDRVAGLSEDARRVPPEAHPGYHFAAGAPAALTWFVRPYGDAALPDLAGAVVRVDGVVRPTAEDPDAPGALAWSWAPAAPGDRNATLAAGVRDLATLVVRVP